MERILKAKTGIEYGSKNTISIFETVYKEKQSFYRRYFNKIKKNQ